MMYLPLLSLLSLCSVQISEVGWSAAKNKAECHLFDLLLCVHWCLVLQMTEKERLNDMKFKDS
jgi:hypothetical protein